MADLWPIEKRVLAYLDQHGPTHRDRLVVDLAAPDSRLGRGVYRGSNSNTPRLAGAWCRRLVKAGQVLVVTDRHGFYRRHEITPRGRRLLRLSDG